MPNTALNDGSIDANMFQHKPYLNEIVKTRHYNLVAIGKTFIYPMGIYSRKYISLQKVPVNAIVAIPNDPSNEARALLLLSKAGLIQLRSGANIRATTMDVTSNPKNLQIKVLDAAQLPRVLPDVDLAVINTNYAIPANLTPTKDALFIEDASSPYANIVVVRKKDKNDPRFKQLLSALHSKDVLLEAERLFKGQAIPAWGLYAN
jgi:D-methionine transport system substrate-binding protein